MKPCEHCPSCGSTTTFTGAYGCKAPVQDCWDDWHCRHPEHQRLAHALPIATG